MRRAEFSLVRLAPVVVAVLIGPSCYSLPKVEVIRVIDDFAEDGGLAQPTWNVFEPWTCGLHVDRRQEIDGGQDASQDGGQDGGPGGDIEAGQAVTCTLGLGTGNDMDTPPFPGAVTRALVAAFDLTTSSEVEVSTRTKSGAISGSSDAPAPSLTLNLTGFSQLLFNAKLLPTPPGTAPLPPGTELQVELHCSSTDDLLVDQDIMLTPGASTWKAISLPLSAFIVASQHEACLATVDSIAFVVVPGAAPAGTKVSGTLLLDDIRLQ